jgi:hypothetical protein
MGITANVNLTGDMNIEEIPAYAIYNLSTKGFKIKLSKAATYNLNFSWIALAINDENKSINSTANVLLTPSVDIEEKTETITPSINKEDFSNQEATKSARSLMAP